MINFKYRKVIGGEETDRAVFPISKPSDFLHAIDLSEFDKEEQEYYFKSLSNLFYQVKEEIDNLGLGNNYRNFKEEGITYYVGY